MQLLTIERDGTVALPAEGRPATVPSVIEQMVALYGRRGFEPPWLGYLAVEEGACVGTCAFTGPPAGGEVEIAYFTFPGNEARGVATRMAAALLARTRAVVAERGLACIAHTLPQEGASTAILRRLGFAMTGATEHPEDGVVWKWRKSERFM